MSGDTGAYAWRKYGEKIIGGVTNALTRSYFRCTVLDCTAKKRVDRQVHAAADEEPLAVLHIGQHNHLGPETSPRSTGLSSAIGAATQQLPPGPYPATSVTPTSGASSASPVKEATVERGKGPKAEPARPCASLHQGLSSVRADDIAAAQYKDLHTLYCSQTQCSPVQWGLPSPLVSQDSGVVPAKCNRAKLGWKRGQSAVDSTSGEMCLVEAQVSSSSDVALVPDAARAPKRARVASKEPWSGTEGGFPGDGVSAHQGVTHSADFALPAYPVTSSGFEGAQREESHSGHHLQGLPAGTGRPASLHIGQVSLSKPQLVCESFSDHPSFSSSLGVSIRAETKAVSARCCYQSLLQPKQEICIEEESSWKGVRGSGSRCPVDSGPLVTGDGAGVRMDRTSIDVVHSYSPFEGSDGKPLRRANDQALNALLMGTEGVLGHSFAEVMFDRATSIVDLPALALETGCHNLLMALVPQSRLNEGSL